jgi:hypothetical protein
MTETHVTDTRLLWRTAYTAGKVTVSNFIRRHILSEVKQPHEENSAL